MLAGLAIQKEDGERAAYGGCDNAGGRHAAGIGGWTSDNGMIHGSAYWHSHVRVLPLSSDNIGSGAILTAPCLNTHEKVRSETFTHGISR